VEKLFDEQWEADKASKDARAERDREAAAERNRQQRQTLDAQIAHLNTVRQSEAILQATEQRLRVSPLNIIMAPSYDRFLLYYSRPLH
jgi:hypothetical protein